MTGSRLRAPAIVVLITSSTPQVVWAQVQQGAAARSVLRIEDAVNEALARSPELIALRQEYEAMRAAPAQERHLAPPMFESQIWAWPVTTLNPIRTDMYMFLTEQELPGRGKRSARVLVAEKDADLSLRQVAVRANEVVAELKQAYVDLALARATAAVYERQHRLLEEMAEASTLRYAAGHGVQHHTVTSLVELSRLQTERIAVEERARLAEGRLNTLLGRPPGQPVEPVGPVTSRVSPDEAEARAVDNHPDLAMATAAVARAEAELARLRNERRPDFVVGGGYMLMPGDAGAWTARAGLTWPNAPWSRGRLDVAIDVQAKRVTAARAQRDVRAAAIRRGVHEAAVRLTASQQRVQLLESTVLPQIEHVFELARVGYTSGEGAFADMLESRRLLLSVQVELAAARADADRARADLDSAAGVL